jgi:flagellar basal-body rod protein FlgF
MDVAVKGQGYLAVQAPDGTEAYTRRGDLKVDVNGVVTTGAGLPVIGNSGPIALPPHERIEIAADGTITILPEGSTPEALAIIDRIKLVNPPVQELMKGEDGLMRLRDGSDAPAEAEMQLVSGAIESSNVNVADALVDMIELSRKFEFQVRMMKTAQELDASSAKLMQQG